MKFSDIGLHSSRLSQAVEATILKFARGGLLALAAIGASAASGGEPWQWTHINSAAPTRRFANSMSFDSVRNVIVLFGGQEHASPKVDPVNAETWELAGTIWTQRIVAGPSARAAHRSVFDSARSKTVLFGGGNLSGELFADTWEWNGITWLQSVVPGPSARAGHAMAYDSKRNVTVLFGGTTLQSTLRGDTWEWNGIAWTLRSDTGPSPRTLSTMAFDEERGVCVLFGGYTGTPSPLGDTWEWDGIAWTQRFATGPQPRMMSAMDYDERLRSVVLVGGRLSGGNDYSDTWKWDGAAWTELNTIGGVKTAYHGLARDRSRDTTARFGNQGTELTSYTWFLNQPPCPADLDGDGFVADADFVMFVFAYDLLSCEDAAMPVGCLADMNGDSVVDDADFQVFLQAYNQLVCDS